MANNLIGNVKLNEICRVCLRSDGILGPACDLIIPKFDTPIAVIELWRIYNEILTTQEAGFPDKICSNCVQELQSTYRFMLKCEKADAMLKQIKQIHFHLTNQCNNTINSNISDHTCTENNSMDEDDLSDDLECINELSTTDTIIEIKDDDDDSNNDSDTCIESKNEQKISDNNNVNQNLNISKTVPCTNLDNPTTNFITSNGLINDRIELNDRFVENLANKNTNLSTNYNKQTYKCPRCSYTCINSINLHRHIFRRHVENITEDDDKDKIKNDEFERQKDGEPQIINIDSESENNDFVLTPLSVPVPSTDLPKQEPIPPIAISEDSQSQDGTPHFIKYTNRDGKVIKSWECGICSRNFQHQYTLMRHLPTHTNVRNFVCNECGKAFRQLSTLSQHRAIHSIDRPYACETCNKSFNRISTLISHRKTHSEVKPFRCHMCQKGFHQKGNLRNHIYIHTNERPYRCPVCNKGFNQMSNLVCHSQKSHSNEYGSIWTCHRCNMSFSKRTLLRAHELETHHIQGTNMKTSRSTTKNGGRKTSISSIVEDSNPPESDGRNSELCKSVISENGILIPAIDTEAMKIAKINKEMPFAVLHFFEGPPLLVRIVDYGNQSLLRPTKNEDFISLKSQQNGQTEKVCVPIVAAVYQTLNVTGRPEFKVMPPKNIYKFINQQQQQQQPAPPSSQTIPLNCDNNNVTEKKQQTKVNDVPVSNIISLTPPQIPSDLRDVTTDRLETPLFEMLNNVKDEPTHLDENTIDFLISSHAEREKQRAKAIAEEANLWNKTSKMDLNETLNEFPGHFQNMARGSLLTPRQITENDLMPDTNASILDISEARNPLLCQGEPHISNLFNNDNLFNYNNMSISGYCGNNSIENSILSAFRNEGMDANVVKSLFNEHPGLLDDINECLSEIIP